MTALATTLQAFFTDRLARQRQVSPNTLAAYRDTLRLLLVFAADKKGKEPSKLDIDDLDAPLIGAFLDDLEHQRKNGARTRNARLAAIRSLFRYASPSRSCRPHRARSRHPSQALRQKARDLPDRAGNQRTCLPPPIGRPGLGGETTRSSVSPRRLACEHRS
jgi:site-specific recombinase XerD